MSVTTGNIRLPIFKYHPDPIATGSIVISAKVCRVCGIGRGYIYQGAAYSREDLDNSLCPWCIADGSAHARFGVHFVDREQIGGGAWDAVPLEVVDEIAHRTPGFSGWQQERWFTHCGDGAEFLDSCGRQELEGFGAGAIEAIRTSDNLPDEEWEHVFAQLNRDTGPATAYLFRCRKCGQFGGYWDSH